MKKIFLVLLIVISCSFVSAKECDYKLHQQYASYAGNITYDNNYSISSKKFTVNIYNIIDDLYIEYHGQKYKGNSEDVVTIEGIDEGDKIEAYVYADDGCTSYIKAIFITEPYYNIYLNNEICNGYENKIVQCTSKFLSYNPDLELIKTAIHNYENEIVQENPEVEEPSLFQQIIDAIYDFTIHWGIKIALVVLSVVFTFIICNNKFNKIKHGV